MNVVKLVKPCVLEMMGLVFVIPGFFVAISRLVGTNSCWLKKQKDLLAPEKQEAGDKVMWTSGLVFGRGEGIIGLETEHGTLHIKLLPDCSPLSVKYILELLALRHCAGCHFYRAESRGQSWDAQGKHIKDASFGPPFAIVQGILEAQGMIFNKIPSEYCPTIRRGSVAWVGSGPEFFISLANHEEWKNSYTVFGFVLPEDLMIAEKIAQLPTKSDVWNNINVSVLENPVPLRIQRMKTSVL
ncbi:peptidylprolyl isomerase [Olea europaea subsp. europaea]|uniref:Peptidylprolyl isomerase n=1 Tax=Olea europaea subsp. europaea TaxID=158383 RepID=A0A8S0R5R3_OLEEU|nr:peptidylprolyl isomerase [Olea europaea subsp. europaea]